MPLSADEDAEYDEVLEIDLSALEPLVACPHSPDNVKPVKSLALQRVDQVCIGSCTNSSYTDLMTVAAMLKGRTVCPEVSLTISPGSRQVLAMLSANGSLTDLLNAGARVLEATCGPCIGMGQSPNSGGISLRTFNRNFEGRSGTRDAGVYLVSPETAAASCLTGFVTDPSTLPSVAPVEMPAHFSVNDNMIDLPAPEDSFEQVEVLRGPNIKPLPQALPLTDAMALPCLLKVGDNITTDHICLLYTSFHIPAYCIQNDQQAFDSRVFLHSHQLRDDMLVLRCFLALRRKGMPLYLPNHRKAVDGVLALGGEHAAHFQQVFLLGA